MIESMEAQVAVLSAEQRAHNQLDSERFGRISTDMTEIKSILGTMATDLKSAVERIHGRIDTEAETARDAIQEVSKDMTGTERKVTGGMIALLLGLIGWVVDHFVVGVKGS